jgi:hypothetical protein
MWQRCDDSVRGNVIIDNSDKLLPQSTRIINYQLSEWKSVSKAIIMKVESGRNDMNVSERV